MNAAVNKPQCIQKCGHPTGSYRTLNPEQEKIVQRSIRDKCPDQLKLPFALWIFLAVQQLIKYLHGIDMQIRMVLQFPWL